jgi:hypothetical protein
MLKLCDSNSWSIVATQPKGAGRSGFAALLLSGREPLIHGLLTI